MSKPKIYFSDFFDVKPNVIEDYGAFNVSLINDLPLFIDPFLLFNSDNADYNALHEEMIRYLIFLRDRAMAGHVDRGLLTALYTFKEVKQNWFGFSAKGNGGSGLGPGFGRSLCENLQNVFASFGEESVTKSSHLEKLCLIDDGVGKDNISDLTTNLIKGYLLDYTQEFARQFIVPEKCSKWRINRVSFNYATGSWNRGDYILPTFNDDYVILTPRDILTKDSTWISRKDMFDRIQEIADAVPDDVLRSQFNEYLASKLKGDKTEKEQSTIYAQALRHFPAMYDHYISQQEANGDQAIARSSGLVQETQNVFVESVQEFVEKYLSQSGFYQVKGNTLDEARERVNYFKHIIENSDGYRLFYNGSEPIRREKDVQLLFMLTWYATPSDVNREPNNGRGPVDFAISRGGRDKSLVEFKLASNSQLRRNLENQVAIYEAANRTTQSLKVIIYFTADEEARVVAILKALGLESKEDIILIDARPDNKPSASKA